MNNTEEKLKEKSYVAVQLLDEDDIEVINLPDALEILKDLYTKEEVRELLKIQRQSCATEYFYNPKSYPAKTFEDAMNIITSAPQPILKGESK